VNRGASNLGTSPSARSLACHGKTEAAERIYRRQAGAGAQPVICHEEYPKEDRECRARSRRQTELRFRYRIAIATDGRKSQSEKCSTLKCLRKELCLVSHVI
jgi:hypothetical protein